jgi:transposase
LDLPHLPPVRQPHYLWALMHDQSRLCAMSYSGSHETSNLRTFVLGSRARGFGSRATLQRRFRPAQKPDTSGEFSHGVPPKIAASLGCASQTVRNAIHAFNERGLGALEPGSSRPRRTQAAFDEKSAEAVREILHRSPREFGRDSSLWTLEMAAEVSFEQGLIEKRVCGETIRATLARLLGVRWQRAKRWITSPDPLYERKKDGATD